MRIEDGIGEDAGWGGGCNLWRGDQMQIMQEERVPAQIQELLFSDEHFNLQQLSRWYR
jgi:hypothetical protein